MYSIQAIVHWLGHPDKLLPRIFDVLFKIKLISGEAFIQWFESTEAVGDRQAGREVALKSCTQFVQLFLFSARQRVRSAARESASPIMRQERVVTCSLSLSSSGKEDSSIPVFIIFLFPLILYLYFFLQKAAHVGCISFIFLRLASMALGITFSQVLPNTPYVGKM